MEGASHWTASRTAASVTRATAVPCATRRGSCSTPAVVCHANTVAARSQTLEMPFVTVRAAILGSSATPVGLHSNTLNGRAWRRHDADLRRLCLPESECRGEPMRDFYQVQRGYAICQTTRMVSWVECSGVCDKGACCASQRMKRRKYTFECSDGTSFSEEVEKTIKCGCVGCM